MVHCTSVWNHHNEIPSLMYAHSKIKKGKKEHIFFLRHYKMVDLILTVSVTNK
jgi:hypothetical protein